MLARPPLVLLSLSLVLTACPGDEPTTTQTGSDTATSASSGTTGATEPTGTATDPNTGTADASGTADPTGGSADATGSDVCASRPGGDWNDCAPNGPTDNSLCDHVANGAAGEVTCLSPAAGSGSVCGIRDCVDDCDCWAPPTTGTAIATCTVVFGGGGKGCVLYCLNGQVCPDGMECISGTCYWPH